MLTASRSPCMPCLSRLPLQSSASVEAEFKQEKQPLSSSR